MRIIIRPRAHTSRNLHETKNKTKTKTKSGDSKSNSKQFIEQAISNLSEAVKVERCDVCKTWIKTAKKAVEDKFEKLKYSQNIYDIMRERKIKTPWRELDNKTKEMLRREGSQISGYKPT